MDRIPSIRLVFILTKNDITDFDRTAVSQRLRIIPTKTCAPALSKGKVSLNADINEVESELSGLTILRSESCPYQMIKHAYWSIELPQIECWGLDKPLQQIEQILLGKESEIQQLSQEYNLRADLIVRVFAKSNNMPELIIPHSGISFFSSLGTSISFDFYLD